MRSAGRLSRLLVVLGILSLVLPETGALASGRGGGGPQKKAKTAAAAKKSKEKLAVSRSKMKNGGGKKGSAKAAGFLPRPGAGKTTGAAGGEGGRGMLASAISGPRTASATPSTSRASTATKARRQTRLTKKTRRPTAKNRRSARTQRNRPRRSSQGLAAGEMAAAEMAAGEGMGGAEGEMSPMALGQGPTKQPSRFRRIMSGAGKVLRKTGKAIILTSVVVAPMAVMAAGGLPIAFAIGAPAIFLGIPMVIGLIEQRAKQAAGIDDPNQELLQRYMSRQMLENQDLNGPGPGNGVAGVGGLNTLNNMIDPGGMR